MEDRSPIDDVPIYNQIMHLFSSKEKLNRLVQGRPQLLGPRSNKLPKLLIAFSSKSNMYTKMYPSTANYVRG